MVLACGLVVAMALIVASGAEETGVCKEFCTAPPCAETSCRCDSECMKGLQNLTMAMTNSPCSVNGTTVPCKEIRVMLVSTFGAWNPASFTASVIGTSQLLAIATVFAEINRPQRLLPGYRLVVEAVEVPYSEDGAFTAYVQRVFRSDVKYAAVVAGQNMACQALWKITREANMLGAYITDLALPGEHVFLEPAVISHMVFPFYAMIQQLKYTSAVLLFERLVDPYGIALDFVSQELVSKGVKVSGKVFVTAPDLQVESTVEAVKASGSRMLLYAGTYMLPQLSCALAKAGLRNIVMLVPVYNPSGFWITGDCTPELYAKANFHFFKTISQLGVPGFVPMDRPVKCLSPTTRAEVRQELETTFQTAKQGHWLTPTYTYLWADIGCTLALTFQSMLVNRGVNLETFLAGNATTAAAANEVVSNLDYEAITKRLTRSGSTYRVHDEFVYQMFQSTMQPWLYLDRATDKVDVLGAADWGDRTSPPRDITPICEVGSYFDLFADECTACPTGKVGLKPACDQCETVCQDCSPGSIASKVGMTQCTDCRPGEYASKPGMSHCSNCSAGSVAMEAGAVECTNCTSGQYVSQPGSAECAPCPFNEYQPSPGSKQCLLCSPGLVTLGPGTAKKDDCVCASGTYHDCQGKNCLLGLNDPSASGFCQPCPKGMECIGPAEQPRAMIRMTASGAFHKLPDIESGRMAIGKVTYDCAGDGSACPGATLYSPVNEMCAYGGAGVACSLCSGESVFDGDRCKECTDNYGFITFIVVIIGLIFVGVAKSFPVEPIGQVSAKTIEAVLHSMMSFMCFSILTGLLQATLIFSKLNISWTSPSKSTFSSTASLFTLDAFRLTCAMSTGPKDFAVMKTAMVNVVPAILCLFFGVLYVVGKKGTNVKRGSKYFPDPFRAISILVGIMVGFFMTIVNSAVNVGFARTPHPNGETYSLEAYPWLLTTDSEVKAIQAISIAGLVVWCTGFLAVAAFVIYKLPSRATDASFRLSTINILVPFKVQTPWWMLVQLVQNVMIVLSLSFFTDGEHQRAYAVIVFVVYAALLASYHPHLFPLCHYTDLLVTIGKVTMLIIEGAANAPEGKVFLMIVLVLTYAIAIGALAISAFLQLRHSLSAMQHSKTWMVMEGLDSRFMRGFQCDIDFDKMQPYAQNEADRRLGLPPSCNTDSPPLEASTPEVEASLPRIEVTV